MNINGDFSKILKKLRERAGFKSQSQLAEASGVDNSTIARLERGETKPTPDTLKKLAPHLNVNYDYLMASAGYSSLSGDFKILGETIKNTNMQLIEIINNLPLNASTDKTLEAIFKANKMLREINTQSREVYSKLLERKFNKNEQQQKDATKVPILGTIHAGLPLLAEQNWEGQIDVPSDIKGDFCLRVEGDSMIYAGILTEDIAVFKQADYANHGQIVAAGVEDASWEAYLKFYIEKNDRVFLRSANPNYEDIEFGPQHRIIGVMVGLIRESAPSLGDYQNLLQVKEYEDRQWMEVIEIASSNGMEPIFVKQIIETQIAMASHFAKSKSP
ncbi:LexA family transcriptional regulator [Desulfoscipio geothermicus]|uniref:Repressor LexA n=1 Tax=Desulfoscipio geothermicus DSM 3669 TaxID=1121426 RepID=A0A1I6ECZ5_9FIRM|nr:LexA family transcriptional regulator [Desulfoscipio geothermicus]SFR15421.1 repressor LexA [Desulfoscipio geothermicus DSM 3669]